MRKTVLVAILFMIFSWRFAFSQDNQLAINKQIFDIKSDFITMERCNQSGSYIIYSNSRVKEIDRVEFKKQDEQRYYVMFYGKILDVNGEKHPVYSEIDIGDRQRLISILSCLWKNEEGLEAKIIDYIKKIDEMKTETLVINNDKSIGFEITEGSSPQLSTRILTKPGEHSYGIVFYKALKDIDGKDFTIVNSTQTILKEDLQKDVERINEELRNPLNEELVSPLANFSKEDINKWKALADAGDPTDISFAKDNLIKEYMAIVRNLPEKEREERNRNWDNFLSNGAKLTELAFKEKCLDKIDEFEKKSEGRQTNPATNSKNYYLCNNYTLGSLISFNHGEYFKQHPNTLYKLQGQVIKPFNGGVLFWDEISDSTLAVLYTEHKFKEGDNLPAYWVEYAGPFGKESVPAFRIVDR